MRYTLIIIISVLLLVPQPISANYTQLTQPIAEDDSLLKFSVSDIVKETIYTTPGLNVLEDDELGRITYGKPYLYFSIYNINPPETVFVITREVHDDNNETILFREGNNIGINSIQVHQNNIFFLFGKGEEGFSIAKTDLNGKLIHVIHDEVPFENNIMMAYENYIYFGQWNPSVIAGANKILKYDLDFNFIEDFYIFGNEADNEKLIDLAIDDDGIIWGYYGDASVGRAQTYYPGFIVGYDTKIGETTKILEDLDTDSYWVAEVDNGMSEFIATDGIFYFVHAKRSIYTIDMSLVEDYDGAIWWQPTALIIFGSIIALVVIYLLYRRWRMNRST